MKKTLNSYSLNTPLKLIICFSFFLQYEAKANFQLPTNIKGKNLLTEESIDIPIKNNNKNGLVIIFLSAKCPCSNSHIKELKELAEKYKDFNFFAVHSNMDESKELTISYFKQQELPFTIIQDLKASLADEFRALKTPHAYVINNNGELLFQGGVTNSSNASIAKKHFLADALSDISLGKKPRQSEARTLGCAIARKGEFNDW